MAEIEANTIADLIRQARERLNVELRAQAEHLQKLEQNLQDLRGRQQQLEEAVQQQFEILGKFQPPAPSPPPTAHDPLEKLLAAVRNLITATLPEQVLEVLTEEAEGFGVRGAVFEVRGKAAWGASARGFGSQLSQQVFRALVVPLNQDNLFRQVYETGGHTDGSVDLLKKNRNILEKLRPNSKDPILLLPIRSAGSVSAIFYADAGGKGIPLPVDALKILAEFAGAQLDRLMALSGGVPAEVVEAETVEAEPVGVSSGGEAQVEVEEAQPWEQAANIGAGGAAGVQTSPAPVFESIPVVETPPPTPPRPSASQPPAPAPAPAGGAVGVDLSQLSEVDRKVHQDAKRFAKLLVSEIDLYNKAKVADGRKNKNVYKVLKSDIERSRQTYEKRFGKTVGKQFDYFRDEVVRTLASNDPSLLGADYPGPSV